MNPVAALPLRKPKLTFYQELKMDLWMRALTMMIEGSSTPPEAAEARKKKLANEAAAFKHLNDDYRRRARTRREDRAAEVAKKKLYSRPNSPRPGR